MAITKPKTKVPDSSAAADTFISGAPDAARTRGVKKGNKQQISLTIAPTLLAKVDELAAELGQSRAAIINMAIYRAVEHGLIIDSISRG
ncbi:MAG: ribbon-helix-helix domain-containing protein [Burkholderiales bacterium]